MNTFSPLVFVVCFALALSSRAERGEFNYSTALPSQKNAIEVNLRRNPFRAATEEDRPLPVLRDKDDPILKLPTLLNGHIRSIVRQAHPLMLIDNTVCQPGDEVRVGREPVLPKFKVVLKAIEADRLIFQLTSLDPQQPGQLESQVLLAAALRGN